MEAYSFPGLWTSMPCLLIGAQQSKAAPDPKVQLRIRLDWGIGTSEQIRDNHTLVNMAPEMSRLAYPRLQAELLHVDHARVVGRISREGSERHIGQRRQTQEEFTWACRARSTAEKTARSRYRLLGSPPFRPGRTEPSV